MAMSDNEFQTAILIRLDKMIEERSAVILAGSAPDFAHYLALCEGLKVLKDVAQACLEVTKEVSRKRSINPAVQSPVEKKEMTYRA